MLENKLIYWDSCSFIHLFQPRPECPEYSEALNEIVMRARKGECKIITSAVSIAEVCKIPEMGLLPIEQTKKILGFFENEYVGIWQADRLVCEEAHHIVRLHGLMPMDAIHIATAIMSKVDLLITTDSKKYRRKGLLPLDGKIGNPPLQIKKPDIRLFLPLFATAKKDDTETTEKSKPIEP